MTDAAVKAKVDQAMIDEFELDPAQLHADAHLVDDLELDSLDSVDLIAAIEREFGQKIDEKAARRLRTVGDVYAFCEALRPY